MKKTLLCLLAALAILQAVFVPVSADNHPGTQLWIGNYLIYQRDVLIIECIEEGSDEAECKEKIENWFKSAEPKELFETRIIDPPSGCYSFGTPTLEGAEFIGWDITYEFAPMQLDVDYRSITNELLGSDTYSYKVRKDPDDAGTAEIGKTVCVDAEDYSHEGLIPFMWNSNTGESGSGSQACVEMTTDWEFKYGGFYNKITFTYRPGKIGGSSPDTLLTVRCMDAETETELPYGETVEDLEVGTKYSAEAPEIDGYYLLNDAQQTVTLSQSAEENLVTFWYAPIRETSYEVRFECDGEEEPLAEPVLREGELSGTTVRETAPEFEGCELEGDPEQALTLGVDPASNILTFHYKRLYADVTLLCVDENGEEIRRETVEHQPAGKALEFEIPEIAGYEFDGDPEAEFIPVKESKPEPDRDEEEDEEEKPAANCFILRYSASENSDAAKDPFEELYEAPADKIIEN